MSIASTEGADMEQDEIEQWLLPQPKSQHLLVPDPGDEAAYVPGLEAAGFLLHVRGAGLASAPLLQGP